MLTQHKPAVLTVAQQLLHLRRNPICAGSGELRGARLIWDFPVTPHELARTYSARIEYHLGSVPKLLILDPDLSKLAKGRKIPHVYSERPMHLCLYLPRTREWKPDDRLDLTIAPWTYLWLFYFEDWLATSDWKGEGEHPRS
jgi:hypothetical protein